MNVQIIGDGIEIDDRIREVVETKMASEIEKYLKDFADDLKKATVRIEKLSHGGFHVNWDMRLPGKNGHIFSQEDGDDLLNVLIALRKEVESQVRDYKERLQKY